MLSTSGTLGLSTCAPYIKIKNLDGTTYKHPCDLVIAIDRFLMSECPRDMTKTQLDYAIEFVQYEDENTDRADLDALNSLFAQIVISRKSCEEIQGGGCGKVY